VGTRKQGQEMNLTRRGFLKAVGALGAGLVIPDFRLIVPEQSLLVGESFIAPVRELIEPAVSCTVDEANYIVRHDIIFGHDVGARLWDNYKQATVTSPMASKHHLQKVRNAAAVLLATCMREHGVMLADLHGLPMPIGYEAAYMGEYAP